MKRLSILITAILLAFTVHAQIEKGEFQVGAAGLPVIYPGSGGLLGHAFKANVGYSPFSNFVVGVQPFTGKVNDVTTVGLSLYARQYLTKTKLSPFIEGGVGVGKLKYGGGDKYKGTLSTLNLGAGAQYKVTDRIGIELSVQYARLQNISSTINARARHALIPTLGVQYTFGKKK
ncbi:MAG: outer membrane beta-barrel protein [Saprospiraceae bacterium]